VQLFERRWVEREVARGRIPRHETRGAQRFSSAMEPGGLWRYAWVGSSRINQRGTTGHSRGPRVGESTEAPG